MSERAGPDTIYGSSASCECIFGRDGDDKIWGGKGDTFVFAGKGDDIIRAGPGKNYIDGQKGKDTIWVHAKAQVKRNQSADYRRAGLYSQPIDQKGFDVMPITTLTANIFAYIT